MKRKASACRTCVAENLSVTGQSAATNDVGERENKEGPLIAGHSSQSPLFRATDCASPNFRGGLAVSIEAFGQRAYGEPRIRLYYLNLVRLLAAVLDLGFERTNQISRSLARLLSRVR